MHDMVTYAAWLYVRKLSALVYEEVKERAFLCLEGKDKNQIQFSWVL